MTNASTSTSVPQIHEYVGLRNRVRATMGARFKAARRLATHARLSQWMPALLSLGLIVISVMETVGLLADVDKRVITTIEVSASALLLVFSLLLGLENYAVRAEKSHRCGVELGELMRRIEGHLNSPQFSESLYNDFNDSYTRILSQYENHEECDFKLYLLQYPRENYPECPQFVRAWITAHGGLYLTFWPYILLLLLSGTAAFYLRPSGWR